MTDLRRQVARELVGYQSGRVRHPDLDDIALFVELMIEWTPEEVDESAALLLFLVQSIPARDAVLLQWATDLTMGDKLWQSTVDDRVVSDLKVGIGPRPDPSRLDRGIAVVQRLLWLAPPHLAQAPHFMLAWLRWARSDWPSS